MPSAKGSFEIRIQAYKAVPSANQVYLKAMNALSNDGSPPPLRIFVVENHRDSREYLQMYLEGRGHTVDCAETMAEALAALPKAHWDVLISDIGLPDGDGWELLERLRLAQPIYAIAMSGFGMSADHLRSRDAGYRHHLLKPFSMKELAALLEEAASERQTIS